MGSHTYNVSATIGIEPGGADKTMWVHFLRVRDQYPNNSDGRYPNSCRDHWETTINVTAGNNVTVDHDFNFDLATTPGDWDALDNARFIVFAQAESPTKNIFQAAVVGPNDCPVVFTAQPLDQQVCAGDYVQLNVAVTDPTNMTFQWQKGGVDLVDDGVHIVGAATDTLEIADFGPADEAADYQCMVTNGLEACSSGSSYGSVQIDTDTPVFTQHPASQTVDEGSFASFSITLESAYFIDLQWYKDGVALTNDGHFFGVDTDTLNVFPVAAADEGEYHCEATFQDGFGGPCANPSNAATLTVNSGGNDCPEDLNGDQTVGLGDLSLLLSKYGMTSGAQPEDGDIDGDGDVDLADLALLLAAYGQDCPTQ